MIILRLAAPGAGAVQGAARQALPLNACPRGSLAARSGEAGGIVWDRYKRVVPVRRRVAPGSLGWRPPGHGTKALDIVP